MADEILPSEVRAKILDEHAEIRGRMVAIRQLLGRIEAGHEDARAPLSDATMGLFDALAKHLDHEDQLLVPILETIDAWGKERARRLSEEHEAQRMWIDRNRHRVANANPAQVVAAVETFLQRLEQDMSIEEQTTLSADLLTEYPFPVDLGGA